MQRPDGTFRKRMRRWDSGPITRYLTFSCYRRAQLLTPEISGELAASLAAARLRYKFRLLAWVIMPEHVHLMIEPPQPPAVGKILTSIKQPVALSVIKSYRRRGIALDVFTTSDREHRVWQEGGGFDRNVRTLDELRRETACIHANPVERGLGEKPIDWEWSSARWFADIRGEGAGWGGRIPIDRSEVDWGLQNP